MVVGFSGLGPSLRRCAESEFELVILLDRAVPALDGVLGAQNFDLFCTPAVNLFPKRADRIHINERDEEFHLVPDRMRPMDFEVYEVTRSVEHTSELQSLMRSSYAVFRLQKNT